MPVQVILMLLSVLAIQGVVWLLIFARFRQQARWLDESIRESGRTTGEYMVIAPERAYHTWRKGIMKTMGVIALTNQRIIFLKPFWGREEVPLSEITGTTQNVWFAGQYHNGQEWLILQLKDGRELGFQVKNTREWANAIHRPAANP